MKYEKLVAVFAGLLVIFFLAAVIRLGCGNDELLRVEGKENPKIIRSSDSEIEQIKREQSDILKRLDKLENGHFTVNNRDKSGNVKTDALRSTRTNFIEDYANLLINETITPENIDRSVWNQTNMPGVNIVSIQLEKEPYLSTLLVWTGVGIIPQGAYNVKGKVLSVVMQQSKGEFIGLANFISVRYLPKE